MTYQVPLCSALNCLLFENAADPLALSVAIRTEPLTAAITLEAGLRLQYEAIEKQLPGAAEDEDDRRDRGTHSLPSLFRLCSQHVQHQSNADALARQHIQHR
jgi:hypothetical protein